jgi:hypothetical protein
VKQLVTRFDDAAGRRDRRALRAVEADVVRLLDAERREARVELAKDRGELRDDRRDVRAVDRRDLRDDRRDLRDDRRDLRRVKAIDADFRALRGRMDRRSIERKRALLGELFQLARAEVREDRGELREDRREAAGHRR